MARWNEWFTPRHSDNGGQCVETMITTSTVYVRNSKRPAEARSSSPTRSGGLSWRASGKRMTTLCKLTSSSSEGLRAWPARLRTGGGPATNVTRRA